MEPIDPPVRTPVGGWPHACLQLELVTTTREVAYYSAACAARRFRMGVVAQLEGVALYAWPHQTVDEIAREHLRHRRAALAEAAPPPELRAVAG